MSDRKRTTIVALIIAAVVVSGLLGFYVSTLTQSHAQVPSANSASSSKAATVNLDVVPDWAGSGYDAFVLASNINGTVPTPGSNSSDPGPNNNNITVSANTPVKFVITSIDTAVLQNFSGKASTDFQVYNDTDSGQVAIQYNKGDSISNMPIGHTFTITELGVNIPIPPDTIVSFTLSFAKPGVYMYFCATPCGPGMGLPDYMNGFITVQ